MTAVRARVLRVLAIVAFATGFATLGLHMMLPPLLLETQLTGIVYGIGAAGLAGAVGSLLPSADGARSGTGVALTAAALNAALLGATFVSTSVLVALPPVDFAMDVGDTLPDFEVEPRDPEGRAVRLADLRGEPVVLVFHRGGWCPFCQAELVGLNDHYDELAENATVLAVSVDVPDAVRAYARARDLRFTLLHDEDARVARQYGLTYANADHGDVPVPATIVLDGEGRVAWFHVARDVRDRPDPEEILAVLRSIT